MYQIEIYNSTLGWQRRDDSEVFESLESACKYLSSAQDAQSVEMWTRDEELDCFSGDRDEIAAALGQDICDNVNGDYEYHVAAPAQTGKWFRDRCDAVEYWADELCKQSQGNDGILMRVIEVK